MKTILLTGATGFLGSHLLKRLLEEDYNVIILKRSFSNVSRIKQFLNNSKIVFYDIDKVQFEQIFKENNIETIIHCATNYGRNNEDILNILESNLMFPITLLELAIKYKVKTFINTDSYFNKNKNSYEFLLNYSLSKKSLNLWLKYFSNKIQIINMLLEHIYGENDSIDKFVELSIQKIAIKQVEKIDLTPGQQKRDFIYVQDVCDIYISSIQYARNNLFTFKEFDIGTGVSISIFDFVSLIKEISGSKTHLNFGAIQYRKDEIMYSCANIETLKHLNVFSFTSTNEGILKIINYYSRKDFYVN